MSGLPLPYINRSDQRVGKPVTATITRTSVSTTGSNRKRGPMKNIEPEPSKTKPFNIFSLPPALCLFCGNLYHTYEYFCILNFCTAGLSGREPECCTFVRYSWRTNTPKQVEARDHPILNNLMVAFDSLAFVGSSRALSFAFLSCSLPARPIPAISYLARRARIYTTPPNLAVVLRSMERAGETRGKRKASGTSSLPSITENDCENGIVVETPQWFKSERVRCLTDANTPRDEGDPLHNKDSRRGIMLIWY